jgi:PAS domain S-box-containing protein
MRSAGDSERCHIVVVMEGHQFNCDWLQRMLDSITHFAVFSQSTDGTVLTWNSGAESLFQRTRDDAIGRNVADLFVPEDREQGDHVREMRIAAEQGFAQDDRWHERRDGTRFWASGLLMRMTDESGRPSGFVKVVRDLTLEKRAEEQLRHSEEEYAKLFLRNAAAMAAQNAESRRFILFNDPFLRLAGYYRAELLGQTPQAAGLWPEDSEATRKWHQTADGGEPQTLVFELRRRDGEL